MNSEATILCIALRMFTGHELAMTVNPVSAEMQPPFGLLRKEAFRNHRIEVSRINAVRTVATSIGI